MLKLVVFVVGSHLRVAFGVIKISIEFHETTRVSYAIVHPIIAGVTRSTDHPKQTFWDQVTRRTTLSKKQGRRRKIQWEIKSSKLTESVHLVTEALTRGPTDSTIVGVGKHTRSRFRVRATWPEIHNLSMSIYHIDLHMFHKEETGKPNDQVYVFRWDRGIKPHTASWVTWSG